MKIYYCLPYVQFFMTSCAPVFIGATWLVTHKSFSSLLTFCDCPVSYFWLSLQHLLQLSNNSNSKKLCYFFFHTDLNVFPLQSHFCLLCFLSSCSFRQTTCLGSLVCWVFFCAFHHCGTTSTFSCTTLLSFSCSNTSLKHFYSPPPMHHLHFFAL